MEHRPSNRQCTAQLACNFATWTNWQRLCSYASSACQDQMACSQTALMGFEALTGGCDMTATITPTRFMEDDVAANSMPDRMNMPSVTYVSLTGESKDLFADDDGHRFLVLQCHGHVRVVQACKGEYGKTEGCWTRYTYRRSEEHGTGCVR